VKCDGLGEQAVSSHGQVRAACGSTEALQMVIAPPAHTPRRKTFLGLRGTLSWAKHGRPLSSKHCRHYSATTQSKPTAKHALPNTAISAQHSLSPRTATRPNHVLGASRPLLLKSLLLASPASSLFLPVCTAVPHSVLAYEPFLPVKPDSSPAQARMYRRHLPRRTRGTG
jgi:hypothetical protein